jgi:hypothetical protein
MKDMKLILKAFVIIALTLLLPLTLLYAAPAKPQISRQPAGATYSKNAMARFYVNASSVDGGYLEYQWYRSGPFSVPESNITVIKAGATTLPEGITATLITTTPDVTGAQYYYYWVKITNIKNGDSDFVESALAQTKIVDRTLHTSLMQGDFEGIGTGQSIISTNIYWNTTHDGTTPDPTSGFTGNSANKKVLEMFRTNTYGKSGAYYNNNLTVVAELSPQAACSNYQDIATVPGKIYEWSLDHGARDNLAGNPQVMAVVIGPAINMVSDYTDFGITDRWLDDAAAPPDYVYPYGKNYTTYFYDIVNKLASDLNTTVVSLRTMSPGGAPYTTTYGGNIYYVYISSDEQDLDFVHRSGVYSVPAGQGTTVFGFVPITLDNGAGNLIDNVIFASGSPFAPSPIITYDNAVTLSATTKDGYIYGIAELRGSSVSLVNTDAYYDPDGAGAIPEEAIFKTSGLGIDGWYSTDGSNAPFVDNGVIIFKNLTPGKTYRIVGIPLLAVNNDLHVNESPEYVFDEGYYTDVQTPSAYEGNNTTVWNIDVETYMDGATQKARISVKNARNDVEYALLADNSNSPVTSQPAHSNTDWITGTSGYATFNGLTLDAYYYLVVRPGGYDEVTYADAAYDVDGLTPKYIKIKTPGTVVDINKDDVARDNCPYIELKNSKAGYTYAVVDPETGMIIGGTLTGNGSTLTFPVSDVSKAYQIIAKSGDVNWMKGVRVYGCPDNFSINYRNETVKSSHDASGNIPTNVEYHIRSNNAGNTWVVGNAGTWTAGIGTQPVDLAAKILAGNTVGILDSITSLNAGATLSYRIKAGLDGYTGQSVSPVKEIVIPKRPAKPGAPINYTFDYVNERITVVSDSLHFAQTNASQWTKLLNGASWTFTGAGWGEGASKRPFNVRIPATDATFASVVHTDTIVARPPAPDVGLADNGVISKIVVTDLIAGSTYQYHVNSGTGWQTLPLHPTVSGKSDSIAFTNVDTCFVRLSATADAPTSFVTVLTVIPLSILPVYFTSYAYGATPVPATVTIRNRVNTNITVTSMTLDGVNAGYYSLQNTGSTTVPANGSNMNWKLTPANNLDANTYNVRLKMMYTYNSTSYTGYGDVYLTVEKANWNMSGIAGSFDVSQTRAQQLKLNITGAPAGAALSYYYGSTPATGNPESSVASDGTTTFTFTSSNGLQPSSTYPVSVIAKEDNNHNASSLTVIATGYTAYATPVFNNVVSVDYVNERLMLSSGYSSADYTIECYSCAGTPLIASPYSLYDILEDVNNGSIVFSIVHNAGVSPPYPASEKGYSGTISGRTAAPTIGVGTVAHASSATSYDGTISVGGLFAYRIHGSSTWSSASNTASGLGVGDYDLRYPATSASFASRWAMVTVSTVVTQPSSITAAQCCIHDTLLVEIPPTANTVKYQWYGNTSNSNTGGSAISDTDSCRFPVPAGLTAGTYYYYCEITIGGIPALVSDATAVTVTSGLPKHIQSVSPSAICLGGEIRLNFSGAAPHEVYYTVDDGVDVNEYSFTATGSSTTIVANTIGVYTFRDMLDGYVCECTNDYSTDVKAIVISGVISKDTRICYGVAPEPLTSTAASGGSSGDYNYRWLQSVDGGATWTTISGAISKDYQPDALEQTTLFKLATSDKNNANFCDRDTSNIVTVTVRPKSLYDYPDLRIRMCPDAGTSVNLSKYIDTLDVTSLAWESVSPYIPISNTGTGTISTNDLNASTRVYTLAYTVSNPCVSDVRRIVYLDLLKNGRMHRLRDSIVICYKYAEALQLNQILGIDADAGKESSWSFEVIAPDASANIDAFVTKSQSPTFNGAVIMNGKAIFENTSARKILVKYKSNDDSCLGGKEYKMKIVLTDN